MATTTTTTVTTMVVLTTDGEQTQQQDQSLQNEEELMDDNDHHDEVQKHSCTATKETKEESTSSTTMMIGLYYYYFSNGQISMKEVEKHVEFQNTLCCSSDKLTGGRIRVCREGLNGVLSGTRKALEEYEHKLEKELQRIETAYRKDDDDNKEHEDVLLDMKYCYLRSDLSMEEQLFQKWSIKSTSEVVSLHVGGGEDEEESKNGTNNRSRRRKKKKNKGTLYPYGNAAASASSNHNPMTTNGTAATTATVTTNDKHEETTTVSTINSSTSNNDNPNNDARLNSASNYKTKYIPAQHLSPEEWHEKLLSKSNSSAGGEDAVAAGTDDNDNNNDDEIILVDARNVYESRVGYFDVPNTTTLLTNTRKYSDLPHVLQSNLSNLSNKHIMMYCTGGVRCERASQYLQSLFDSKNESSTNDGDSRAGVAPPKGIYQLKGGIQRYLEQYGSSNLAEKNNGSTTHRTKEEDNDNDNINNSPPLKEHEEDEDDDDKKTKQEDEEIVDDDGTTQNDAEQCFFKGKNFVFDPRRLDPVCHPNESVVGRCLLCRKLHDDYDNGHHPSASKEARCCRCRILILICNNCRQTHACWGESLSDQTKPNVYCGPNGVECIDEGNLCTNSASGNK